MALDLSKLIVRFLDEAFENLDKINKGVVGLEKNPDDKELVNEIFRSAHTIKGSSRMMKLAAVTTISHKIEDVFDAMRGDKISVTKELVSTILDGTKALRGVLDQCANNPSSAQSIEFSDEVLFASLEACVSGGEPVKGEAQAEKDSSDNKKTVKKANAKKTVKKADPEKHKPEEIKEEKPSKDLESKANVPATKVKQSETIRVNLDKLDDTIKLIGEMVSGQSRFKERIFDAVEVNKSAKLLKSHMSSVFARTEDKSSDELTELMKAVDALSHQAERLVYSSRDDFAMTELLTGELQEKSLKLRMVPIASLFDKFELSLREIAYSLNKEIDFDVSGADTEIDKKIIEKVEDPLMHMLRNSLDHGIETSIERKAKGKDEKGKISVNAFHEGGNVIIVIKDDGNGIDRDKVIERAIDKGIVDSASVKSMSDEEIYNIIFEPGFSTSAYITDISGRGVGMDVVKRNVVEDLRGSIRIDSKKNEGTTFYISVPIALSVMRVLKIKSRGEVFALPVNFVSEIIKTERSEIIEVVDRHALRLREEIIPVVDLSKILNVKRKKTASEHAITESRGSEIMVVFVVVGSERLGLIIDSLLDEEDMVIKPLPPLIKGLTLVLGAIISGQKDVINVLHVPAIIKAASQVSSRHDSVIEEENSKGKILVVDDSLNTRDIEKSILESYGYLVDIATDGAEGLAKVKEGDYDLVVTDVEMPNMDGFTLTENIRSLDAFKKLPVIIVTSLEKKEDKERGFNVGANAYIVKGSFDQTNLIDTVRQLIG